MRSKAALILCLATAALPLREVRSEGPKPSPHATPTPANIDRNGVLIMIRSSLLALDQANKTGNYTVLRDLGAPGFQVNTAAKLAEIFAKQRNDNIDLSGVAALDPQLTVLPQIEGNGMLHMAGFFPSVPPQVNFELLFAPVGGQWRLFGLSVNLGQAAPVPPAAPAPAPASSAPQSLPAQKQPVAQAHKSLPAPKPEAVKE
ncbi:hypothetical protein [Bradyrhizobium sp. Cp5.3]|uniref:hypothetical protein n=1 Tax=Bradyrhizobium sp. Cp5.3 TaxID=443598 RepID=UPI0005552C39|nr:hypothetical protein [Bradyrhizobium sp. Cp5.3]